MVKRQFWQFIYRMPESFPCVLRYRTQIFLPVYADQCIISYRDNPPLRVTVYFAKSMELLHVQIAQPGKLIQYTFSGIVDAFILLNNISRQSKPVLKRLFVPLDQ